MSKTFNKLPAEKIAQQRPIMTPRAKEVWLAASTAMYNHFKEYGIEQYAVCFLPKYEQAHQEAKLFHDEEWLHDMYHNAGMTTRQMAQEAGCSQRALLDWMDKYDISRDREEEE